MGRSSRARLTLLTLVWAGATLWPAPALTWPMSLERALYRDALRLLPRSLAALMRDREQAAFDAARGGAPSAPELASGRLDPETLAMLDAQLGESAALVQRRQVGRGLVQLGALFRAAASLSDPVLCADGPLPAGVASEYYKFVEANLTKIPVVLDDGGAMRLSRDQLPAYWQSLLVRSRDDAPVIRLEMLREGRVVSGATIDYRSPVFAVASLAYSRAVNGIAATWLVGWRGLRGDQSGSRPPRLVAPSEPPAAATGDRRDVWKETRSQ